jgi:hypothetical protein
MQLCHERRTWVVIKVRMPVLCESWSLQIFGVSLGVLLNYCSVKWSAFLFPSMIYTFINE